MPHRPSRPPRVGLLLLAYLAFVSLGLPDGLLGVGWPSIRAEFEVPTAAVGLLLTASTTGYLLSSVAAGFTLARLGVGWLLAGSTAMAGVAITGFALTPGLLVMGACGLLLGLGSGAVDAGLNAYAAEAFGPRHMNWLHACFGLGVALGPMIMTAAITTDLGWRWGYAIVAVGQLALALAFTVTARAWRRDRRVRAEPDGARPEIRARHMLVLSAVWYSAATFALYTAVEVGTGLWAFLLLTEGRGLDPAVAGICVAGYWGSLFLGRVVQGVVAERIGSRKVLLASLAGMAVGAALVAVPAPAGIAVAGLAIVGFAAAPVFPLLTLTTAARVGSAHADRAIGVQIGAACLGGASLPSAIGFLIGRTDVEVLGPALLVLCLLMIALYAAAERSSRPDTAEHRPQPGTSAPVPGVDADRRVGA